VKNGNIVLRYIKESDIEDYVRWTTTETEWNDWDAPWEEDDDNDFVERQKNSLNKSPHFYNKLEIDTILGKHIGWVSCYETEYDGGNVIAVGIDIPAVSDRGKGNGKDALTLYMAHLFKKEDVLYAQTWSGNTPMLRLAEKIGFVEVRRIKDLRQVKGVNYDALTFAISKNDFFNRYPQLRK
jgi:RimJ/RimL family protein N-acetyltransferase